VAGDDTTPQASRIIETHVSRLVFVGNRVYKSKLPVHNDFLDFTTVAARHHACWREVELNRRLAPESYLGVLDVSRDGEAVDHVVEMVRHPTERRLSNLLDDPGIGAHLEAVARLVAELHARTRGDATLAPVAGAGPTARMWRDELDGVAPFVGSVLDADEAAMVDELVAACIEPRAAMFEQRVGAGAGVDGHGDLQAEDIFIVGQRPQILDCLEFDDQLRQGDAVADVAFLAMDLERLGRPDLAPVFLDHYRRLSGDRWPPALEHLHIAERAHVRCKVACLRHLGGDAEAADVARSLHRLALGHLRRARPLLVVVGGAPGTGKSTLARELAVRLDAVVLSTDELRGAVVGDGSAHSGPLDDPADEGAVDEGGVDEGHYRPEAVSRVYTELLERATRSLSLGERVVLDASWTSEEQRTRARSVGRAARAATVELCTVAPLEVTEARIERRRREGTDASEATVEVARRLAARRDPWPTAQELDTTLPPEDVAAIAEHRVEQTLRSAP